MIPRIPLLAGLLALAIALGVGSMLIADGIRDRDSNDVISVTGSAKQRITSDYIVWNVSVSSQRATPAAASKELAGWSKSLRDFLRSAGIEDAEVTARPIFSQPVEDDAGDIVGRRLTRSFEIRSERVEEVAGVVERTSSLLARNIPVEAGEPQYVFTKLADLRPQLIAAATKDALARAEVLIEATGGELGNLRSVNVGVFQVTSPNSTEVSDYGVYDTTTREKDVTAVVNVSFAVR